MIFKERTFYPPYFSMCFADVFRLVSKQFKILYLIIAVIAVFVMYNLIGCQVAAQVLLHHKTMF